MMMMMTTLIVALVLGSHAVTAATFGCNICGGVNFTFLNSLGVVTFDYGEENKQEKRPCQQLQQEVEDPTIYNRTFCLTHIPTAAMEPCRCVNTEGELLTDLEDPFGSSGGTDEDEGTDGTGGDGTSGDGGTGSGDTGGGTTGGGDESAATASYAISAFYGVAFIGISLLL